jgi:hypothetical protein
MGTVNETYDARGVLVSRVYYDAAGQPTTAAAVLAANTNLADLTAKIPTALANNATYLAIGSPTNAQVAAQVAALTRQIDALGRIVGGLLDSTAGT